ncbi:MAG: cyclase family protein [Chitinophagales bacterium]|nr:cyclase family protein [Chitinophagales bacterium]
MKIELSNYQFNLTQPIDISIGMHSGFGQVNAWYAPPFRISPVKMGDFVGSTKLGGSVNFMNFQCNPHGNGTHTECVGHIAKEDFYVNECIKESFYLAELISVYPTLMDNGDKIVDKQHIEAMVSYSGKAKGIIIRTLPNDLEKKERQYTETNPPYITIEAMQKILELGFDHLMIDTPSVDREKDDGKLACHHLFWNYPENTQSQRSITELIYVPNDVKDGLYLVQNQIINIRMDAVPSRPLLYAPINPNFKKT